jgi:D-alanyl-D-alanine carboxypeptidase
MNKLVLLTFLVFLASISCRKESIQEPDSACGTDYTFHPEHNKYRTILEQYRSSSIAPGSILGISKPSQPVWIGAYGKSNLEHGTAMTACTPFRTGSITKVFTAVVIMKLIEQQLLSLDHTIADVLPGLAGKIPSAEKITVKMMLNHSSGLSHPTEDDLAYQASLINDPDVIGNMNTLQRLERYIYDKPLKNAPGKNSYYSNAGYWILELMAEKKTGKPLQQLMDELIFAPLHMDQTYLKKRDHRNVSRGYHSSGRNMMDVTQWDRADSDGDPSAGVISTAADLLTFGTALFEGGLVSSASLAEMKRTTHFSSCPGGDCGYGLGIENYPTDQHKAGIGKNGSSLGVDANLVYFPAQQTCIVLFSNYGGGNRKSIFDTLLNP